MCFVVYVLVFHPPGEVEDIPAKQFLFDSIRSITISFLVVYVPEWIWRIIDSKGSKSE